MILPGSRVKVWDPLLYKNDKKTPDCHRPATVVSRYGIPRYASKLGPYPDLIDVVFDHRPTVVSHGHFLDGVKGLDTIPLSLEG